MAVSLHSWRSGRVRHSAVIATDLGAEVRGDPGPRDMTPFTLPWITTHVALDHHAVRRRLAMAGWPFAGGSIPQRFPRLQHVLDPRERGRRLHQTHERRALQIEQLLLRQRV